METCGALIFRNVKLGMICFSVSDTVLGIVKIRQTDCSCTVINFRNQLECTLHKLSQWLRSRGPFADVLGYFVDFNNVWSG